MITDLERKVAGWTILTGIPLGIIPLAITLDKSNIGHLFPRTDDTNEEMAQWFLDYQFETLVQMIGSDILLLALIVFTVPLARMLMHTANRTRMLVELLVPLGVFIAAIWLVSNSSWTVAGLAGSDGHPLSPEFNRLAFDMASIVFFTSSPFVTLYCIGISAALFETKALPRWNKQIAWSGIAVAIIFVPYTFTFLITSGPFTPFAIPTVLPYAFYLIWLVAIGWSLLQKVTVSSDRVVQKGVVG